MVESSASHVSMAFSYSDTTGVSSDTEVLKSGQGNRVIWATGRGAWPNSHSSGNYGIKHVYWLDGVCGDVNDKAPIGPAIIFLPLLFAFILASRWSPLRVWGDLKKNISAHDGSCDCGEEDGCLETMLFVRLWRRWRVYRVNPAMVSGWVGEFPASWLGSQSSLAGEFSLLGQYGLLFYYLANLMIVIIWATDGSGGAQSWSRAFGTTA